MSNRFIGVFDSGMGGVAVVKYLAKYLPRENIVFLADYKNCPYGSKSKEELIPIVLNNIKTLNSFDLKAVVIACNTAEAVAGDEIKSYFSVPVHDVIKPTCLKALNLTKNKRVGVFATIAATNSGKYVNTLKSLDKTIEVFPIATPELVPLIENGKTEINDEELLTVLKPYLSFLKENEVDTLVLGCTHYDLLSETLSVLMPNVTMVSSSECVADYARMHFSDFSDLESGTISFYSTADVEKFEHQASIVLKNNIKAKLI